MRRRKLLHPLEDAPRIGHVSEGKEIIDRARIDPPPQPGMRRQRRHLGARTRARPPPAPDRTASCPAGPARRKAAAAARPTARTRTSRPAGRHKPGPHSSQACTIASGVAPVAEHMSRRSQHVAQRLEIVDLAVEHDADRAVLVVHRLLATLRIDDRQSAGGRAPRLGRGGILPRPARDGGSRRSLRRISAGSGASSASSRKNARQTAHRHAAPRPLIRHSRRHAGETGQLWRKQGRGRKWPRCPQPFLRLRPAPFPLLDQGHEQAPNSGPPAPCRAAATAKTLEAGAGKTYATPSAAIAEARPRRPRADRARPVFRLRRPSPRTASPSRARAMRLRSC